jgi:hypothetical protein
VLGEPGHLHGPPSPRHVRVGRNVIGGFGDFVQRRHVSVQACPQVGFVHGPQRRLTFLEPARGNRLAGQVRAQHPGEFFGVAGLMDDDVADRPGFTPAAGVGAPLLDGV